MAFQNMCFGLVGQVPGMNMPLAQTFINEALFNIYEAQMWSWQFAEAGWLTPGLQFPVQGSSAVGQSGGTITTTAYSDQVVGDATAAAAWLAYFNAGTLPLLTSYQIRVPYYSLYSIIAYDGVDTFTLDRPWMEPDGAGQAYMVYQAYFPAPVQDFKRFFTIRDTKDNAPINYSKLGQRDLAVIDAQRVQFNLPGYAVPYEVDKRGAGTVNASPTLGYMLYELWPHPLSVWPYTIAYLRRGPALTAPSDTVPFPLNEELVMWRAKEVSYQWKEAQKGDGLARGSGADWRFLAEAANREYERKRKIVSDMDRDLCEAYFTRFTREGWYGGQPYAGFGSLLNVGRM